MFAPGSDFALETPSYRDVDSWHPGRLELWLRVLYASPEASLVGHHKAEDLILAKEV